MQQNCADTVIRTMNIFQPRIRVPRFRPCSIANTRTDHRGARVGRRNHPEIDHRGALWFAAVGLCNGLSVLAMYGALEYGPVAVVSPLIAGYPLVTLLLSRALLVKEDVGLQLIAGVTVVVYGVILLLVA
jgi:drug/metabolite transporter (DMT)-like permease